uniref:Uncharacterized protein n=1 Tax=Setaria viridis TaxID=4556 RepID=A0A4U6WJ43_SETVI|nr:hypothetical protein SEVIR_1G369700v2 [Setaria viridis]
MARSSLLVLEAGGGHPWTSAATGSKYAVGTRRRSGEPRREPRSGVDGISFTVHPLGTYRPFDRILAVQIRQSRSLVVFGLRSRMAELGGDRAAGGRRSAAFFNSRGEKGWRRPSATPIDSRRNVQGKPHLCFVRHGGVSLARSAATHRLTSRPLCFLAAASRLPLTGRCPHAVSGFTS